MKKRRTSDETERSRFEDHDYHGYYKSARKGEKRKKRHRVNEHIRDLIQGKMTPEEYEEHYGDDDYQE